MKNPRGFKNHKAFLANTIDVEYQWDQLFKDPSVIELFALDQVFLGIEFSNPLGTKNNWTADCGSHLETGKGCRGSDSQESWFSQI